MSDKGRKVVYGPADLKDLDYARMLGNPGEYPYTRGIYPEMYRKKKWTVRLFCGHGTPSDTNGLFKMFLAENATGLSTAFDLPTLMGRDSDEPICRSSVCWDGVAIDTLRDMENLFDGIPIDKITISMTSSGPAAVILAMYIAVAKKRNIPLEKLGGTIQTDILKEFIAQKEWLFPVEPSMRLVIDMIEFTALNIPKWNPISISGYHIREAGATAKQELAFTLANGVAYVREAINRGLNVDDFAPQLSFFFDIHNNFFEEIAKLRAARRLWAHIMRGWFGAQNPKSQWCRMHVQTAGCSLTRQEPLNNIARVAIQALAGALGGAQSMHTNSYDEVFLTPTEKAARVAVRTQQIIQLETGICDVADPLGGAYFVEALTDEFFEECMTEIEKIERMGGMAEAVKLGYPQRAIQEVSTDHDQDIDAGKIPVVGHNIHVPEKIEEPEGIEEELALRQRAREEQFARLAAFKHERLISGKIFDTDAALDEVRRMARTNQNIMPFLINAVEKGATLGEVVSALKDVWGVYKDEAVFIPRKNYEDRREVVEKFRLKNHLRILVAKNDLDGHDRPIFILASFLRDLGAEVIYPGLHLSCEELAKIASQEDIDVLCVSTHTGDVLNYFERLVSELRLAGLDGVKIIGGGIIRESEEKQLKALGVSAFFPSEKGVLEKAAKFLKELADGTG